MGRVLKKSFAGGTKMRPNLVVIGKIMSRLNADGILEDPAKLFRVEVYTDENKRSVKTLDCSSTHGYYALYYIHPENKALLTLLTEQIAMTLPDAEQLVGFSVWPATRNCSGGMEHYREVYEKALRDAAAEDIKKCVEILQQIFSVAETLNW